MPRGRDGFGRPLRVSPADEGGTGDIGTPPVKPRAPYFRKFTRRGESVNTTKLTTDQVLEIRKRYKPRVCTYKDLGREYGVVFSTIRDIVKKKAWAWVKEEEEVANEREE